VIVKKARAVKWMYLLNGILFSCNSCTVCKPVHYKLVPDVTVGPQQFGHISASRKTNPRQFSVRSQEEQRQKYVELVVPGHRVFLVLIGKLSVRNTQTKVSYRRPFICSSTPNPQTVDAQSTDQEDGCESRLVSKYIMMESFISERSAILLRFACAVTFYEQYSFIFVAGIYFADQAVGSINCNITGDTVTTLT
jgi:hypothetical protein